MRQLLMATTAVGICIFAAGVHAQTATNAQITNNSSSTTLQEVTVTAERRKSTVQKTAASISVRNGDEMLSQGRLTMAQILEDVPGVTGAPNNSSDNPAASVTIRGTIPNSTLDSSASPTTGVYVDGVLEGLGTNYDVENVQVLRGPQGTLYGRTATGGVIVTTTRDPELGQYHASFTGTYGSYDLRDAQVSINIPIGDSIAIRAAGHEADQLGYLSHLDGATETTEGRVKILYQPAAYFKLMIAGAGQTNYNISGGPQYDENADDSLTYSGWSSYATTNNHSRQYWGKLDWDLGIGTLTYIPAYRAYFAGGSATAVGPGSGIGLGTTSTPVDQYVTQEVRLQAEPSSPLNWITGLYYYDQMYKNATTLRWDASGTYAFDKSIRTATQDLGLFADGTYPIDSTLRIAVGARWDWTRVDTSENALSNADTSCSDGASPCTQTDSTYGLPTDYTLTQLTRQAGLRTWTNWTYRARVEKDLNSLHMIYAGVSTGFEPGDVGITQNTAGNYVANPFGEETLTAFEIGSKNRFLDNTLQLNASLFYDLYSGYEDNVQLDPNEPGSPTTVLTSPMHAAGGDLEAIYRLTPDDRFNVSFGEQDDRFVNRPTVTIGGIAYAFATYVNQKRLTGVAPTTFDAGYDHTFDLPNGSSLDAQATMTWTGGYYATAFNSYYSGVALSLLYQKAETLGNVSATWRSPSSKYSLGGYIRNIADSKYLGAAGIQSNGQTDVATATPAEGRTFGVQVHAAY